MMKLDMWGDFSIILQSERSRILGEYKGGGGGGRMGFVLVHFVRYLLKQIS